jgi:hypothetical protein
MQHCLVVYKKALYPPKDTHTQTKQSKQAEMNKESMKKRWACRV